MSEEMKASQVLEGREELSESAAASIERGLKDVVDGNIKPASEVDSDFGQVGSELTINEKIEEDNKGFEDFKKFFINACEDGVKGLTELASDKSLQPGQLLCLRLRASKMIKLVDALKDIE